MKRFLFLFLIMAATSSAQTASVTVNANGDVLNFSTSPKTVNFPTGKLTVNGVILTGVDASATVKGVTKLSVAPVSSSNPIAVGDNDSRNTNARTPTAHASTHASAGSDPIALIISQITGLQAALDFKAPLASPAFTGIPLAPTASIDTNTTQIATTGFVLAQAANATPIVASAGAVGTSTRYARQDHVHPAQTSVTGNAGTATALQTTRTINGTNFDGTASITITAAAGTLTGATLASGVTASSLTSAAGGTFGTNAFNSTAFVINGGALGTPSSGTLTNVTGLPITGITTSTSAQLRTLLSDENGTGTALFDGATSPSFVTPALGTPSALVLTNATGSPTGISLTKAQLSTIISDDDPVYLATANAFTAAQSISLSNVQAQTNTITGLGTTTLPGLQLTNTTAAAAGAQQYSPSLRWTGQGWKTTATAASQAIEFRAYVVPVQGSTTASGNLIFENSVNGGAWSELFRLNSQGTIRTHTITDENVQFRDLSGTNGVTGAITLQAANDAASANIPFELRALYTFLVGGLNVGGTADPGSGIISSATGFRVNNAATSGHVLRGDGTNFVDAALVAGDIPTLNQSTTGSAASLSVSGQTGLLTFTGLASTSRIKTVRDAADTILELGGSYTPTGTWTNMTLVTPALGTPASGVVTNLTGTASININGTVGATTPTTGAFTSVTYTLSLKSTTALATPSALSATQFTGFASTVSGASIMGYGTTNDVSLMNRAGTVCLGIGPNTTVVNIPGSLSVTGHTTFEGVTSTGATGTGNLVYDASPQFASIIGIGQAAVAGNPLTMLGNSATTIVASIKNSNSAGVANYIVKNDDASAAIELGVRGSARTAYGTLVASDGYIYNPGSITIMADNASGVIKFAAGGNTEKMRVAAGGVSFVGTNTNDNAATGNVGQYISASVVVGSATALTTATPKTVTSISLTAGDWDVTAIGALTGASTGTEFDVAIGTTTNSLTGTVLGDTRCQTPTVSLTGADASLMVPAVRVSINATTTYYLIVQETFTVGSPAAYGRISARRVR